MSSFKIISRSDGSLVLFLNIQLRSPLLRLSSIVLLLGFKLGLAVSSDSRDGAAHDTLDAVRDAGTQVRELALGFLGFAVGVLFLALLLEILI